MTIITYECGEIDEPDPNVITEKDLDYFKIDQYYILTEECGVCGSYIAIIKRSRLITSSKEIYLDIICYDCKDETNYIIYNVFHMSQQRYTKTITI